jgi:hypothetical protein
MNQGLETHAPEAHLGSEEKPEIPWRKSDEEIVRPRRLPQGLKFFRNGLAILVLLAVPAISKASELKRETLNAWDDYLRTTNLRMHRKLGTGHPFLCIDEESGRSQRIRQGEILISPTREAGPQKVHDGLIHDWIGAIFIPCVKINDVFAVAHDYYRYKEFYKPTVIESKLLGQTGEEYQFSMLGLKRVLFEKISRETPCLQSRPGKILTALPGVAYTENRRDLRSLKCPEVVPNSP